MRILVVGSGGREHTLVWKLSGLAAVKKIYAAPGNGGMASLAECVPIWAEDIKGLLDFAKEAKVDLTVVGPEGPLALGLVDRFQEQDLRVFGPTRRAAELEWSKAFAKEFMRREGIPTAGFRIFGDYALAKAYLEACPIPVVVKADGLAAGKGSIVCHSREEAQGALHMIMVERAFKQAGDRVVIEECLEGEEVSILAFSDGVHVVPLVSAQDHKPVYDGDKGPNTGGMGCYAPALVVTSDVLSQVMDDILVPAVWGMAAMGRPYKGVLYAGLMLTEEGPKGLEFNCRYGDPENQVMLPLLDGDLMEIMEACIDGTLNKVEVKWKEGACVCVVLASGGYPIEYETGKEITGLESLAKEPDTMVFHAGTALRDGKLVTAGGRVLGVTSLGATIREAIDKAYRGVAKIYFEGMHYRRDIGAKALGRI